MGIKKNYQIQIWQLSSFLDTLSQFWLQPLLKPTNLTNDLSSLKVLILFSTLREHSVNRALTLVGPPKDNLTSLLYYGGP